MRPFIDPHVQAHNILIHGLVAFPPLVEIIMCATHLHDTLALPLLGAAIGYLIVNVSFSRAVSPVYPILTWSRPSDAILVIGTLLFLQGGFFAAAALSTSVGRCARSSSCRYAPEETAEEGAARMQTGMEAVADKGSCSCGVEQGAGGGFLAEEACAAAEEDPLCERMGFRDGADARSTCACCRRCGCGGN